MVKKRLVLAALMIVLSAGIIGCNFDYRSFIPGARNEELSLIRAEIHFSDNQEVVDCYIKNLGIDQEGNVYSGGSSLNYMYDNSGNVIGSYNYQNVLYIKVLPEAVTSGD